jgi:hypothetical protein
MTIRKLIDRLVEVQELLELGNSIPKVMNGHSIEIVQDDVQELITELEKEGINGDPAYGGGCCTITLNSKGNK